MVMEIDIGGGGLTFLMHEGTMFTWVWSYSSRNSRNNLFSFFFFIILFSLSISFFF